MERIDPTIHNCEEPTIPSGRTGVAISSTDLTDQFLATDNHGSNRIDRHRLPPQPRKGRQIKKVPEMDVYPG